MEFEPGQASWQLGYRINRVELALRSQVGELRGELKELRADLTAARDEIVLELRRTHALVETLHNDIELLCRLADRLYNSPVSPHT